MSEIWRHFKCRSQLTGGLRFPLQTAQLTNDVIYYLSSPFKKEPAINADSFLFPLFSFHEPRGQVQLALKGHCT